MHIVSFVFNFDNEHLALGIVVKNFTVVSYPLAKVIPHRHYADQGLGLLEASANYFDLDHLTLALKVIEDNKRKHVMNTAFPILFDFSLQLENSFKVNVEYSCHFLQVLSIVHVKSHTFLLDVSDLALHFIDQLGADRCRHTFLRISSITDLLDTSLRNKARPSKLNGSAKRA